MEPELSLVRMIHQFWCHEPDHNMVNSTSDERTTLLFLRMSKPAYRTPFDIAFSTESLALAFNVVSQTVSHPFKLVLCLFDLVQSNSAGNRPRIELYFGILGPPISAESVLAGSD